MTKKDLRDYIESLFKKRRVELEKEINEEVEDIIYPIVHGLYRESDSVEKKAIQLVEDYEKVLEKYNLSTDWNSTNVVRNINSQLVNWGKKRRDDLLSRVKLAIQQPEQRSIDWMEDLSPVLHEKVKELQKTMRLDYQQLWDLRKLENEVGLVIDKSTTAKKAYEQLKKLGINMEGIEVVEKVALPAIQKFSVDTCVLNGGCK